LFVTASARRTDRLKASRGGDSGSRMTSISGGAVATVTDNLPAPHQPVQATKATS